jgi:hypothetical protein
VLFNLALGLEAAGRMEDAARQWEAYLALDSASPWAEEVRSRLDRLRERGGVGPLARGAVVPSDVIAELARTEPWVLIDFIEQIALADWIQAPGAGATEDLVLAGRMAAALAEAGRDHYLRDLLAALERTEPRERVAIAAGLRQLRESRSAFDLSRYPESQTLAESAARTFSQAGWTTLDAEMQAAFALFFQDQREAGSVRAASISQRALPLGYMRIAARAPYLRSLLHTGRTELDAAIEALAGAEQLYDQAGDRQQVAATNNLMLEVFRNSNQPEEAWRRMFRASERVGAGTRPRIRYLVLSGAFHHAVENGHFYTAEGMVPSLRGLVERWADPLYGADLGLLETGLQERMGNPDSARAAAAKSRAFLAQVTDETVRQQYDQALSFAEARALWATAPGEVVERLSPVITRLGSLNRPFQLAEAYLLRGRAYRAWSRPDDAERDWLAGLDALDREQAAIGNEQLAVRRADRQWSLYAELIDLKIETPAVAMAIAERGRARSRLGSMAFAADDGVLADRSWMPADTTVLMYAVLQGRLGIWTLTREGLQATTPFIPADKLHDAVRRFVKDVQSRGTAANPAELSTLLIPTALAYAPARRLVIVPDGVLHQVPFGLLRVPGTTETLIESSTLSVVPSLDFFRRALQVDRPTEHRLLAIGFGGAQPAVGLPHLPRVTSEVVSIAADYADRAETLLGAAAHPDALRSAVSRHSILHIAGHALADNRQPWRSRLFLAPGPTGDALTPGDISALPIRAGSIVILSACSTAAGAVFQGEGVVGLARPFLAAGASAVLASLWPVRDDDTERTMLAVHRSLLSGLTLVDAVTTVQRAQLAEASPRWQPWIVLGAEGAEEPSLSSNGTRTPSQSCCEN